MTLEYLCYTLALGVGATLIMDLWAWVLRRFFHIPSLNYAMVGRWGGHLLRGRFHHDNIAQAEPISGEAPLGWLLHYGIGVVFGAILLALCGPEWRHTPTLPPALAFGLASVAAPFLILQPGLGAGIAASKTSHPNAARLRSLAAHGAFGLGLYVSALLLAR
ncbi:DUF2938 domain-containing protein [Chromobacterium sinusclupearum]|uniref:DUF2938 domain-containing protein n=1 Tax=Chromobacterium sinusclupearum TaxID=2077146 RepID=A0A2K4MRR5_9NEIS|nr:DUF2938 domain-containing protein [Chromobacterium sinusclupearum]POA99669.1 DUF2938 domain-containing protein [Chromobacterium sinusclupearum]